MGTFTTTISVGDPAGKRWEPVEALVDTGASYTLIPSSVLMRLGVAPSFQSDFELADGRRTRYDMAETKLRLNGSERTTIVIFGGEEAEALLGAYALEGFGLAPDPVGRRLISVPGLLK